MTEKDVVTLIFGLIAGFSAFMWFVAHRKLRQAENANAALLALLEAQKQLVEGVLDLNSSMLADRWEAMRWQEHDFQNRTGVGRVN